MTPAGQNVIEVVVSLLDKATAPLGNITQKLGQLKSLATVALGGWTIYKFAQNLVHAEQASVKLDQAYRNLGQHSGVTRERINELAHEIQRTTTYSDTLAKEAQALLLTFTNVRGDVFEKTTKAAADLAAAMGMELTSATQMLGRALQDPARGMYMLRRARISLTAAEREGIKTAVEQGNTYEAQIKILDALDRRNAGMAATMRNTVGGAFTALQNQISTLLEGPGSFPELAGAINEMTEVMSDPAVKEGADNIIAALARIGSKIIWLIGLAGQGYAAYGKLLGETAAKMSLGIPSTSTVGTDPIDRALYKVERLKRELNLMKWPAGGGEAGKGGTMFPRGYDPMVPGAEKRLKELQAELKKAEDEYRVLFGEMMGSVVASAEAKAGQVQKMAATLGLDPEEVYGRFADVQERVRSELERTTEKLRQQQTTIGQMMSLSDEELSGLGTSRSEVEKTLEDLRKQADGVAAEVQKKAADAAKAAREAAIAAAMKGLEDVNLNVRAIQSTAMEELLRSWDESTKTAMEKQIDQWRSFKMTVEELVSQKVITREQGDARLEEARKSVSVYQQVNQILQLNSTELDRTAETVRQMTTEVARLYTLTDEQLLDFGVDRKQLDEAMVEIRKFMEKAAESARPVNEFMLQAARTLQDAFSEMFMSLGKGWRDTSQMIINSLKQILAQAMAMNLAKALGLDTILEGKQPKSGIGKWLGVLFGGPMFGDKQPTGVTPKAAGGESELEPIVIGVSKILGAVATGVDSRGRPTDKTFPVDQQGYPIDTTRPKVTNEDGSYSTEETITVFVDGLYRNIPTIVDGVRVTAEEATVAAIDAIAKGWKFPSFEDLGMAEAAAADRSQTIGAVRDVGGIVEQTCPASCVGEVITGVGTKIEDSIGTAMGRVSSVVGGFVKNLGAGLWGLLKNIGGGLFKTITGVLSKVWDFLKAAVTAIRAMASSSGATSSGGGSGWAGYAQTALTIFSMFAASGASLPAQASAIVGEETPEIVTFRSGGGLIGNASQSHSTVNSIIRRASGGSLASNSYETRSSVFESSSRSTVSSIVNRASGGDLVVNREGDTTSSSRSTVSSIVNRASGGSIVVGAAGPEAISVDKPAHVYNVRQLEFAGVLERRGTDHREQIARKMTAVTGGNAGGGLLSHLSGSRLMGEETPEVVALSSKPPFVSRLNQVASSKNSTSEARVDYSPVYHINISGARDDREIAAQLAAYIERRDQKSRRDMEDMLRRNGYGRMK